MYRPEVIRRAVWNRSLSYFFHAAAAFSPSSAGDGGVNLPSSLMAIRLSHT
jgi:hypothetical protein